MAVFIANQIMKQANLSIEKGKEKYAAYFLNIKMYGGYQQDVNAMLHGEGLEWVYQNKE